MLVIIKYGTLKDETEEGNTTKQNLRKVVEEANKELMPRVKRLPTRSWKTDMTIDI